MSTLIDTDDAPCTRCEGTVAVHMGGKAAACVYCNARSTLRREPPAPPPEPLEERFESGRFAGMTLAEALAHPNGRRYLDYMAQRDEALAQRLAGVDKETAPGHVVRTS